MFARLSRDPLFATNVKSFYAIAPVSRVTNLKGPMASVGRLHNTFPVSTDYN